eukprot:Opistho-1_new@1133
MTKGKLDGRALAPDQPGRQYPLFDRAVVDACEQRVDEQASRALHILHQRGQRRCGQAGGGDVVEADDRDVVRQPQARFGQRAHRADGDQVACGEHRVETLAAFDQRPRGGIARILRRHRIALQRRVGFETRGAHRAAQSVVAVLEFGRMVRRIAEKGDAPPPDLDQMRARLLARADIVRPDGQPDTLFGYRAPAHELGPHLDQMLELGEVELIIAIAEQDDAVGTVTVLIGDVPVVVHLLETDQQVVTAPRAFARDRSQHRQKEGVDHRFVGVRVLEEEQGERVGALRAQARGIFVDGVVEFLRDALNVRAGCGADRFAAAQCARHGRLRDPRQIGDVETRRLGRGLAPHVLCVD